jgi:hypothetical protein
MFKVTKVSFVSVILVITTMIALTSIIVPTLSFHSALAASNVTQEVKSTTNQTGEQMQSGMANVSKAAENQTKTASSNTAQGVQGAINKTGQFIGNVSETIAENPLVTNITGETQKFFGEASK